MRHLFLAGLLIGAALLASPAPSKAADAGLGTSFVENFDKLDFTRWMRSNGWNNGAHQNCTWLPARSKVENGVLEMAITDDATKDRAYSCSELQSQKAYGFGTYEVRMKAAAGSGVNTAFFTYIGPPAKSPHDEIDFEFLGKDTSKVQLNYYVGAKGDHEYLAPVPNGADTGFNDYAFVWAPDSIRWYINGAVVHEERGPTLPSHPSKIFLSLWGGTSIEDSWLGKFAYPGRPITANVDWLAFTAAGDNCQFPDSLVCKMGDP